MQRASVGILYFVFFFSVVLTIDIWVKLTQASFPYRYMSKPLIMLVLLFFYMYYQKRRDNIKHYYVILALVSFLLGDILLISHDNMYAFIGGMVLFMLGKVFYSLKFSNTTDFKLIRLVPFLLVIFAYTATLFGFIYDNLNEYFIPVLFYFFVSLLTLQIAFLRKQAVNFLSYMLVLFGLELLVIGESILALKLFYKDIPYQDILTIMLYAISQFFIVLGILEESNGVLKRKTTG